MWVILEEKLNILFQWVETILKSVQEKNLVGFWGVYCSFLSNQLYYLFP